MPELSVVTNCQDRCARWLHRPSSPFRVEVADSPQHFPQPKLSMSEAERRLMDEESPRLNEPGASSVNTVSALSDREQLVRPCNGLPGSYPARRGPIRSCTFVTVGPRCREPGYSLTDVRRSNTHAHHPWGCVRACVSTSYMHGTTNLRHRPWLSPTEVSGQAALEASRS